ncbi:MAG: hypothetical protein ACE5DR_05845 [Thermodesulfobacteriota bacterium]
MTEQEREEPYEGGGKKPVFAEIQAEPVKNDHAQEIKQEVEKLKKHEV